MFVKQRKLTKPRKTEDRKQKTEGGEEEEYQVIRGLVN
jgi:hypothetical protein